MARILMFIVAAAAVLAVLWFLLWGFLHVLVIAFWVVLVVVLGFCMYRFGRWSSRSGRSRRSGSRQ
jgi:membrane protein implicated in regulation of membrane protease activity